MPRPKKKTPSSPSDTASPLSEEAVTPPEKETKSPRRTKFLSLEEKRKWLAAILRDVSGQHQGYELSMGDKFKALIEDNKLAGHPSALEEEKKTTEDSHSLPDFLRSLLESVPPPHQQRFNPTHHERKN